MSPTLDEAALEPKLARLEQARAWSPRVVSKFETLIRSGDDAALFRVNPIAFGAEKGLAEAEAIDLFLHAVKAGLFEMEWHLLCPVCSQYVESFSTLRQVQSHFRCATCHLDGQASLDDYIQISFTVSPLVRRLAYHDPASLPPREYVRRYRWSQGAKLRDGTPFLACLDQLSRFEAYLAPGERRSWDIEVAAGLLSGSELGDRAEFAFPVEGAPTSAAQSVRVTLRDGKGEQTPGSLAPGRCTIEVENLGTRRAIVECHQLPAEFLARGPSALQFPPFLTGTRLLMSQTFRDLFTSETIRETSGLGVKSVTMLFTDLKGSTELYERIGDLQAFALVQQHFDRLGRVVRDHGGVLVKTIGDAIMASFLNPVDAVRAAVAMLETIDRFNQEHGKRQIILKLGIHSGASIAVTLNERLDYFGQTVNIAARVQGLADADEIFVTDEVYRAPAVQELVRGYKVQSREAHLKGIQRGLQVHRITFDRPTVVRS